MDVLIIFYFFNNICAQVRPVLKNLIEGLPESAVNFFRIGLTYAHTLTKTFKNQQNVQFSPISGVSKRKSSM